MQVLGERAIGRKVRWEHEGQTMVGTVTAYREGSHYTVAVDAHPDLTFWVGVNDPTARLAR